MMPLRALTVLTLALLASASGPSTGGARAVPAVADPNAWEVGPVIRGRNYSQGVPLSPVRGPAGAWHIDLSRAPGSVHYVTFRHGSLAGKSRIVMRYRVVTAPGVRIFPITAPTSPSIITLYFQRNGDNWSGRGRFESYRWYATFASQSPIVAGEHVLVAPLNGAWTAVEASTARNSPDAFRQAVIDADRVGFVLGGGDGYGHGVFATGPARIIVTSFRVE
jgi:hypothetical protein